MTHPQLQALRRKTTYYQSAGLEAPAWLLHIWPRVQGFNWFIKDNRDLLLAKGAIVKIGRDFFIDSERFPEVAATILGVDQ